MPRSTFGKVGIGNRSFGTAPKGQSSSFASKTPQRAKVRNQHVPGVGKYAPK